VRGGGLGALSLLAPLGCQRGAQSLSGIALVRAELATLLDSQRTSFEAGYRTLDDGMKLVASIHHLSNVSGAMVEWWHRRRKSDEEFRQWHPTAHLHWEWNEQLNAGVSHHLIDGEVEKTKGQAREPREYFDVSRFPDAEISAAICSRGGPLDTDGWSGHIIHLCRDTDYGCEVRTRVFLGDFDPPSALESAALSRFVTDERLAWLLRHQSEEHVYLARFLPDLYARETGA